MARKRSTDSVAELLAEREPPLRETLVGLSELVEMEEVSSQAFGSQDVMELALQRFFILRRSGAQAAAILKAAQAVAPEPPPVKTVWQILNEDPDII